MLDHLSYAQPCILILFKASTQKLSSLLGNIERWKDYLIVNNFSEIWLVSYLEWHSSKQQFKPKYAYTPYINFRIVVLL